MQQTGGIFQAGLIGSNFLTLGGELVQHNHPQNVHNCYNADDGFQHLQAYVAPAAYASQQEGDAPKCHPKTRTAVLNAIIHWITMATTSFHWILWLNGAAGAGKSAIARSIVDLCLEQEVVIARFFFFRTDPTRNTIKPMVATLAYQLIQSIPALESIITPKIQSDPLIFDESFEIQFRVLVSESLQQLHKEAPLEKAIVLLFDGVDECTEYKIQAHLIHAVTEFVAQKVVPLIIIFSSRAEPQLQMAFNSPKIDNILRRLVLDTDYLAAEDIRLFLSDSFSKIKNTHPFRSSFTPEWPAPSLIQEIIDKSSNQFIYAAVVVNFISSARRHPVQQLEIVRGLRPAGELTPFAQLDALYRHIFSQVNDIALVTAILAVAILGNVSLIFVICTMLDISKDDFAVALADVTSIVSYNKDSITFLHASLPDFLLDQSRAQQYHIDKSFWGENFAISFMSKGYVPYFSILSNYLVSAKCTPQLRDAVCAFNPSNYRSVTVPDAVVYRDQLDMVVRYLDEHHPEDVSRLNGKHRVTGSLVKSRWKRVISKVAVIIRRKFLILPRSSLAWIFGKQ